ncbi:FkbM family methyltransferase [Bacteroidia bacterium]|nr:FkbM family methyltransferase [Bacteroidia bacterium]
MNIKIVVGRIFKKLGLLEVCKKVTIKFGYLLKFNGHLSNGINLKRDLALDTNPETVRTVFDIGASIGIMTQYFEDVFPKSTIHCFEPYLPSYNRLKEIYGTKNNVICNGIGLSDVAGEFKMFLQSDSGYNSLNEKVNKPSDEMGNKFQLVQTSTISEYCEANNVDSIDFIKIDTEGLDLRVLKGAENLLKAGKVKYIYAECTFNEDSKQNTPFNELNEYLQTLNFKVRAIYDQSNFGDKSYLTCVNAMFMLQPDK